MSDNEKIELLTDLFELEDGDLKLDTILDELEEWDSITKFSLIALMKKEFNKVLTISDIRSFKTVNDICQYME